MKNLLIFLFLALVSPSSAQEVKFVRVKRYCDSVALASNFPKFKHALDSLVKAPYRFMVDWRYFEMEIRTERSMRLDEVQQLFVVLHKYRDEVFKTYHNWRLRFFDFYVVTETSKFKIEYNHSGHESVRDMRISTRIDYKD